MNPRFPSELSGAIIRHRDVAANYLILRVGYDESKVHYWQAFAVGQLTHRLWVVPKTTNEVYDDFYNGSIDYVGTDS